ncbi:hypothetical protein [Clostridium botulinum]
MTLLKISDGLLEVDNFYLTSSFSDFVGSSLVNRDVGTGKIKLLSNSIIERKFNYNEFVIDFHKSNFKNMEIGDYAMIYLGNKEYTFGIKDEKKKEKVDEQNEYWRILKRDNYVQAYSSADGINYKNIGGVEYSESITKQGFQKYCDEDLTLNEYKVYKNPYVTILNYNEDYMCELYDKYNNLIQVRKFNSDMECKFFIEYIFIGYIIIKDLDENIVFQSDLMKFSFGDVYINSPYNFEIRYNNKVVTDKQYGILESYKEVITIKNKDTKDYKDIVISTESISNDLIELSLDDKSYNKELKIENFQSQEAKEIYIRITRKDSDTNYYIRNFQLLVN